MRTGLRCLPAFLCILLSLSVCAQTTISGTVRNVGNQELVPAVSVTLKGNTNGTFTDENGNFRITIPSLPAVLVFSSVGFETREVTVESATTDLTVDLMPRSSLGQEVVVSASRVAERILESPVSIERVNARAISNAAAPNYYETVANLKGVDLTTSSLTFRTVSTRGFNGSGNLRFNQLVDGMDNQAPGLNFAVGNIIGVTELDVDNMELLQGASSALYGSGGMNGTLLISSKNPFKYQGLSLQIKHGAMHVDNRQRTASPYYDWALRWGQKVGERFAFKVSGQFIAANDWQASDYRNLSRQNVFSSLKPGDRASDPNYDGVNIFGDEASASMTAFAQAAVSPVAIALGQALGRAPTYAEITNFIQAQPATSPTRQLLPFSLGLQNNLFGGQFVSRTGYEEKYLVDYDAYNVKLSGGLYYRITNNIEASLQAYWGTGTTVYTGADRYALKDLKMGQYKAEIRGNNWFLRGYTTQENSGDSYTATTAAVAINRAWKSDQNWFAQYTGTYAGARLQGAPDASAHVAARNAADAGRFLPLTPQFQNAFNNVTGIPISKGGAKFDDKTDLYHAEAQYNFAQAIRFAEVIVGASFRKYSLSSNGTIFADTAGSIGINEYGGYLQVSKWVVPDVLRLTASGRYDKNENFEGRFTPRATALIKVAPDNNFRLSYQQAYRFPSTQDQWINLLTPASRLIGGLPDFVTFFKFNTSPAYTAESIVAYRNSFAQTGVPNPALLQTAQFNTVKPERVSSYEVGYRGLLSSRFLIDAYGYYSEYNDFIARVAVGRGQSASTNPQVSATELISPFTTTNYSFVTNTTNPVKAIGWGLTLAYQMGGGYQINGNVSSDKLRDVPANVITFFNTPKYRFNAGISNEDFYKHFGFNIVYRWQDEVLWEGTFGTGEIPSFGTLDAQLSYRISKIRSVVKLGGSNVLNKYYRSAFGNPEVGGLYYVSFGYNIF